MCADQRTALRHLFTRFNHRIQLRSPNLHSKHLCQLIHFTGPPNCVFKSPANSSLGGCVRWALPCCWIVWTLSCQEPSGHSLAWEQGGQGLRRGQVNPVPLGTSEHDLVRSRAKTVLSEDRADMVLLLYKMAAVAGQWWAVVLRESLFERNAEEQS